MVNGLHWLDQVTVGLQTTLKSNHFEILWWKSYYFILRNGIPVSQNETNFLHQPISWSTIMTYYSGLRQTIT